MLIQDTTFRIAHMGEITMEDIEELLAALEEYMVRG
jgi:aspartate aminotransferase-like enzyme